jgi:GAF domain-containing protein
MSFRRLITLLFVAIGLFLGVFVGSSIDELANAQLDPARLAAVEQCWACPNALGPFVGDLARAHWWTLVLSVVGLGAGLGIGIAARRSVWENVGAALENRDQATGAPSRAAPTTALAALPTEAETHTLHTRLTEQALSLQIIRAITRAPDRAQLIHALLTQCDLWVAPQWLDVAFYDHNRDSLAHLPIPQSGTHPLITRAVAEACARQVIRTQQPARYDFGAHPNTAPASLPASDFAPLRAYLGVPLLRQNQVIGVLAMAAPQRVLAFEESHQRVLIAVAGQLAVTLDQLVMREQERQAAVALQQRATRLEALNAALSALANVWQLDELVTLTFEHAHRLIAYDTVTFWQCAAPSANIWRILGARGFGNDAERVGRAFDQHSPYAAVFADFLTTRRPLAIPEVALDPRFAALRPTLGITRAWLGLPLLHQGEVLGLLAFEKHEANFYTVEQTAPAQTLAAHVALALAKLQRYESGLTHARTADDRARRWQFLHNFAGEVHRSLELAPILAVTLQALSETLGVPHAYAAVFDDTRQRVLARAQYPKDTAPAALTPEATPPLSDEFALDIAAHLTTPQWVQDGTQTYWPLMVAEDVVGMVALPAQAWSPMEQEAGLALTHQAALALSNARLFQSQVIITPTLPAPAGLAHALPAPLPPPGPDHSHLLRGLRQLATRLLEALTPAAVLQITLQTLIETLGLTRASALALERSNGRVATQARWPETHATALPDFSGLLNFLRGHHAPLAVSHPSAPVTPAHLEWVGGDQPPPTVLFVPFFSGGHLLGLLGLALTAPLSPAEIEVIRTAAHQSTLALDNLASATAPIPTVAAPRPIQRPTAQKRNTVRYRSSIKRRLWWQYAAGVGLGVIVIGALGLFAAQGASRLTSLIPPTLTATATRPPGTPTQFGLPPRFTATPSDVPTEVKATPAPTFTPRVTPTLIRIIQVTSTAGPSPTASPRASTTLIVSLTPSPTPAPSASPTLGPGVRGVAVVTLAAGLSAARLRDAPNGSVIGSVANGATVEVLSGAFKTADGIAWVRIRVVTTNESGWFSEGLLLYVSATRPVP